MSKAQFDPANSRTTNGYVNDTDNKAYKLFGPGNTLVKILATISLLTDPAYYIRIQTQALDYTAKMAAEFHVLVTWTIGNLSYQTARTLQYHRQWIWHIWYIRIVNYYHYAQNWANTQVSLERHYRIISDNAVLNSATQFAYALYKDSLNRIREALIASESLAEALYARNRTYINQVLQAAQNAARAAFNDSVAYTNKVRAQLIQLTNSVLQQSKAYTDQQAKNAHDSAVKDADAFTVAAVAALVAGVIASILAQQAELATAEAADAAWIAGEGALLLDELGKFGHDLSAILNIATITAMLGYVAAGVTDAKDTGDITADVLIPILTPISDGVKEVLKVL